MKPSVIVALLVGLVIGFAVGNVVSGSKGAEGPARIAAGPAPTSEADFAVKSGQMPAGTFTGMTAAQKVAVMQVMNDHECDCGCGKGTLGNCILTDPGCPNSPAKLRQAVQLARGGKSGAEISGEMFGAVAAKAAAPVRAPPPASPATSFKVPIDGSPVSGKADALVTVVEFTSYQCGYCNRAQPTLQQLKAKYGDKLRMVSKHNPLAMQPLARPAALAALAAGEQGKFWEYHHKLFENFNVYDPATLEAHARDLRLDVARWKRDMASPKVAEVIARDQRLAQELASTGTPAFFINGRKISGARPLDVFTAVIDEELAKAEALVRSGVPATGVYAKVMESAVAGGGSAAVAPPPPSPAVKVEIPVGSAPTRGPKNAPVTVVAYSDFQCPYCSRAVPVIEALEKEFKGKLRVAFKHQPLSNHAQAHLAAVASLAAHEQNKFWEYHDMLFQNQRALERPALEKYAQDLKLDMARFRKGLDSQKLDAAVRADMAEARRVGANATPTFYVNGNKVVGADANQLRSLITAELAKKK